MPQSISVIVDATHAAAVRPTGVERYSSALLPPLTEALQGRGASVSWVGHDPQAPLALPAGATWLHSPYRKFWSQTGLKRLLEQTGPTLFFTPSGLPPLTTDVATALTVHDLAACEQPQAFPIGERVRLRYLAARAAKRARRIIVPSKFTRLELERFWRISETTISVVPEGYVPLDAEAEPVGRVGGAPFFLYVGRLERKKNLLPLIAGFGKLCSEQDVRLVLAGSPGYGYAEVKRAVAKLPEVARSRIVEPGYITDGQKRWLYQGAVAGVIPCPYEGFGLPVLDCFASGIPAVCAKAGALPEVGRDACLYVVPESAADWYLHMKQALLDPAERGALTRLGRSYLKDYSWKQAAERTAEALLSGVS